MAGCKNPRPQCPFTWAGLEGVDEVAAVRTANGAGRRRGLPHDVAHWVTSNACRSQYQVSSSHTLVVQALCPTPLTMFRVSSWVVRFVAWVAVRSHFAQTCGLMTHAQLRGGRCRPSDSGDARPQIDRPGAAFPPAPTAVWSSCSPSARSLPGRWRQVRRSACGKYWHTPILVVKTIFRTCWTVAVGR